MSTQKTLTKNQRWSQIDKLYDIDALVCSAVDNLFISENSNDADTNDVDISNIVESLDTASHILKEIQKFFES